MKFIHAYREFFMPGIEKNGFINKDTGFKLPNVFAVPSEFQFNNYAVKDGKFYNFIKEGMFPFYVDRVAGGITYYPYAYDKKIIRDYKELLGDWFLGFQMHESASNRRDAEWPRLKRWMGSNGPYDAKVLREKAVRSYTIDPEGNVLSALIHDTPEYYATRTYAEHYTEFVEEIRDMCQRRLDVTDGNVLPADSLFFMGKLHADMGMRNFMPEIGGACPMTRLAVAAARGQARSGKDRMWGTYYECWWTMPDGKYCMPSFNKDYTNEWFLTQDTHRDDFTTYGEHGGSSRILQKRQFFYTLMSGANYMAEEWGTRCSFTDFNDFTLSSYGEVKKEFVNKALNFQGIEAVTPFAIVMPNEYVTIQLPDVFDEYEYKVHRDEYMRTPLTPEEKDRIGHYEDVLKLAFCRVGPQYGNEGHAMTNSRFGDLFDVIYEDASDEVLSRYEYLIDATPDGSFAKAKANTGFKVLESADLDALEVKLHSLEKEVMPCVVDGLHWLVSTDENGTRYLTIFNNEGNERDSYKGDILHREADKMVNVWFKDKTVPEVVEECGIGMYIQKRDEHNYAINVPAAGFVIMKF